MATSEPMINRHLSTLPEILNELKKITHLLKSLIPEKDCPIKKISKTAEKKKKIEEKYRYIEKTFEECERLFGKTTNKWSKRINETEINMINWLLEMKMTSHMIALHMHRSDSLVIAQKRRWQDSKNEIPSNNSSNV